MSKDVNTMTKAELLELLGKKDEVIREANKKLEGTKRTRKAKSLDFKAIIPLTIVAKARNFPLLGKDIIDTTVAVCDNLKDRAVDKNGVVENRERSCMRRYDDVERVVKDFTDNGLLLRTVYKENKDGGKDFEGYEMVEIVGDTIVPLTDATYRKCRAKLRNDANCKHYTDKPLVKPKDEKTD